LAAQARDLGLVFYDAPVLGTRQPAEQGQLIILAAGPTDARAAVQPAFDAIGKRTIWVSEQSGASSRLKLALNHWVFALTHGVAESLALAKGLGVDPALVIEAVSGGPLDNGYFQGKSAAMLSGDYTPSFSVANALKDSRLIVQAAAQAGITLDGAAAGLHRFQRALAAGPAGKDMAASPLACAAPACDTRNAPCEPASAWTRPARSRPATRAMPTCKARTACWTWTCWRPARPSRPRTPGSRRCRSSRRPARRGSMRRWAASPAASRQCGPRPRYMPPPSGVSSWAWCCA